MDDGRPGPRPPAAGRPSPHPPAARDAAGDPLRRPSPRSVLRLQVGPPSRGGRGSRLTVRRRAVAGAVAALLVAAVVVLAVGVRSGGRNARPAALTVARSTTTSPPATTSTSATPSRTAAPSASASPAAAPTAVARTPAGVPLAVTRAVAAAGGDLSVAVYDATDGSTWTYRDEPGRVEASVSKLSVLGAVLRHQQAGAAVDSDVLEDETDMIAHSSNDAAEDLYDQVGEDGVEDFDEAAGASDIVADDEGYFGLDTCTALDQVEVMKALAYPNAVLSTASRARATVLLGQVEADQHWGASGGVPAGVTVDVKNGWLPHGSGWVVNTVGHVSGDGHDYVVAIMSAGNSTEQAGITRLQTVSAAVYATAGKS